MSLARTAGFLFFSTRRPCKRILFLLLGLCAALPFVYHVSKIESTRNGPFALTPVARSSYNYKHTSGNLGLTVASPKSNIMRHPWSDDEEPLVDSERRSIDDLVLEAAAAIRNIPSPPYILGKDRDCPKYFRNSSCARFPTIDHLEFSNIYWQTLRTSNGTVYLYGAYYDTRTRNPLGPTLRILGMMDRFEPNVTTYCQIWFAGEKEPTFSKVLEYKLIWNTSWPHYKPVVYKPYLLICPNNHDTEKVPTSVSVVEKPCDAATNNLNVLFNKPAKKKAFAVCVKGLDFIDHDISVRLVEWIEILGILGADKIFLYEYALHPNATKVLRYYQQTGKIDVTPLALPGSQPNDPRVRHIFLRKNMGQKRLNEVIPYNDCLYRNLYQYEYIAVFDIDEVIMPTKGGGWTQLLLEVDRKSRLTKNMSMSSFIFRHTLFMDLMMNEHQWFQGIPKYLHMLQHVYRTPVHTEPGSSAKCFIDPEHVLTLHNHFPLACLNGSCTIYSVGTDLAQLHHYRENCYLGAKNCTKKYRKSMMLDITIWRYKDELIGRVRNVLRYLGFIPSFHSAATERVASLKR